MKVSTNVERVGDQSVTICRRAKRLNGRPMVREKLVTRASADPQFLPSYLDLIFISRALERIGDHATNIAEDSFWRDQATDIRHAQAGNKLTTS